MEVLEEVEVEVTFHQEARHGNKTGTGRVQIQACNRCGSARPAGAFGGSAGAGGRGRGRGTEAGGPGRAVGAPTGLFGPNDWPCSMCGNINWAKRNKCNICNTNKPGVSEGGVRGGRAGGYKELDEEEIEETRRRRREAEEDDGEMYDEFGNLKNKFRAKMQQAEAGQVLPGTGRAGWDVEELGVSDRDRRERSTDRGREREMRVSSKIRNEKIGIGTGAEVGRGTGEETETMSVIMITIVTGNMGATTGIVNEKGTDAGTECGTIV